MPQRAAKEYLDNVEKEMWTASLGTTQEKMKKAAEYKAE